MHLLVSKFKRPVIIDKMFCIICFILIYRWASFILNSHLWSIRSPSRVKKFNLLQLNFAMIELLSTNFIVASHHFFPHQRHTSLLTILLKICIMAILTFHRCRFFRGFFLSFLRKRLASCFLRTIWQEFLPFAWWTLKQSSTSYSTGWITTMMSEFLSKT